MRLGFSLLECDLGGLATAARQVHAWLLDLNSFMGLTKVWIVSLRGQNCCEFAQDQQKTCNDVLTTCDLLSRQGPWLILYRQRYKTLECF